MSMGAISGSPFPDLPRVELDWPQVLEEVWTHTTVGLCLITAEGRVARCNPPFAQALGFEPEELVEVALERLHPPDTGMAMRSLNREIIAGREPQGGGVREMTFLHRRGRPVAAHARNSRIELRDGTVLRLVSLVDLATLARHDRQLALLHRMENFSALASAISNDFNNLLSIVLGYTALLQEGGADPRRLKIVTEGVEGAVQRASTLVRQSLYLARRPEAELRLGNLTSFVESCVRQVRATHGDCVIEVDLALHRDLRRVPMDTTQLGDAMADLLNRVLMVDPDGQRPIKVQTVRIDGAEVRRRFAGAEEPAYALIEISHPGAGRHRGREAGDSRGPFVGRASHDLGLTMVERIVESHCGFMAQVIGPTGGSVFSLYLPLGGEEESEAPLRLMGTGSTALPASVAGRGVLVIDDEVGLLNTMVESLQRVGYRSMGAQDGETALKLFREHAATIDLVICDLVLPGMNGWEVFTAMREIRADVTVMIMSGHLEPRLEAAVSRSGAAGFLQKPFSITTLVKRVRETVGKRGA